MFWKRFILIKISFIWLQPTGSTIGLTRAHYSEISFECFAFIVSHTDIVYMRNVFKVTIDYLLTVNIVWALQEQADSIAVLL